MIGTNKDGYIITDNNTNATVSLNKTIDTEMKTNTDGLARKSQTSLDDKQRNYPTRKVIANYLFYGGPIGGGLIGLLILVGTAELGAVLIIPVGMILGLGLGLIPATLTGIFAAYFELVREPKDLALVTLVGAFITVIYTLIAIVIMGEAMDVIGVSVMAALLGGLSALITGLLFLPKFSTLQPE